MQTRPVQRHSRPCTVCQPARQVRKRALCSFQAKSQVPTADQQCPRKKPLHISSQPLALCPPTPFFLSLCQVPRTSHCMRYPSSRYLTLQPVTTNASPPISLFPPSSRPRPSHLHPTLNIASSPVAHERLIRPAARTTDRFQFSVAYASLHLLASDGAPDDTINARPPTPSVPNRAPPSPFLSLSTPVSFFWASHSVAKLVSFEPSRLFIGFVAPFRLLFAVTPLSNSAVPNHALPAPP